MTNEINEQDEEVSSMDESIEEVQDDSFGLPDFDNYDFCGLQSEMEATNQLVQEAIWADFDYSI